MLAGAALAPLAGGSAAGKGVEVYASLGITPVINFRGTHTVIGASKVWPEVHAAMAGAAGHYVPLEELQDKVGERLAALIGTEWAMVTAGCAAAIALGTYACLTGTDTKRVRQLPDLTGMKSEVIIQKVHRNGYDHAVRSAGVKIVEVGSAAELRAAISPRTAAMYFLGGTSGDWNVETPVGLEECLAILRAAGVPVMVDAANMLPPFGNLKKLAALGVDLICCSGGKHMRGPQCSGLLAGRRSLIEAARLNSNPHSDSQGRGMKVGREEMVGLWLAAEKYSKLDFAAMDRECEAQAKFLAAEFSKLKGVRVSFAPHDRTRRVHRVRVEWDEAAVGFGAAACEKMLMEGEPRIAVLRDGAKGLTFTVFMNEAGDVKPAVRRMKEIFAKHA